MPSVPWRRHAAAHEGHEKSESPSPKPQAPQELEGNRQDDNHVGTNIDDTGKAVIANDFASLAPSQAQSQSQSQSQPQSQTPPAATLAKLCVQIVGARNLIGKDRNGKSDPFFIVNLPGAPPISSAVRDRQFYRRQTPVQAKSLDPTWKEDEATFEWNITSDWFKSIEEEAGVSGPIDPAQTANSSEENVTRESASRVSPVPGASSGGLTVPGQALASQALSSSPDNVRPRPASRPSNVRKISSVTGRMLIAPVRMTTKGAKATGRVVRKHGRPRPIRLHKNSNPLNVTNSAVSAIEFVCWDKDKWSGNDYMGETSLLLSNWFGEGVSADWQASEVVALPLRSSRRNAKVSGEVLVKVGIVPLQPHQTANDVYVRLLEADSMQSGGAAIRAVPADQSVGTAGPADAFVDDGLSSGSDSEAQEELLTDEEDDDDEHSSTSDEDEMSATDDTDDGLAYDSDRSAIALNSGTLQTHRRTASSAAQTPPPPIIRPTLVDDTEEDAAQTEPDAALANVSRRKRLFQSGRLRRVRSALKSEQSKSAFGKETGSSTPASGLVSRTTSDVGGDEDGNVAAQATGDVEASVNAQSSERRKRRIRVRRRRQNEMEGASAPKTQKKEQSLRKQRRRTRREARQRRQDFAFKAAQGKDIIGIVQIEVKSAHDLPRWRNSIGTSFDMDPFVIVSFGQRIFRTRVTRHTLNPTWDEKLLFHVRGHEANFVTKLVIYDWDKLSSNDYVGETELRVEDLIESAPKPDERGLYDANADALHQMKTFTLPLARSGDGSTRNLGSHSPTLTVEARFTPYSALRQRFWRQLLTQYDTNDSGTVSLLELTSMLDSLNSTLTRQTIEGFFSQFNKNANTSDELTIAEAIIALEGEIVKPYSQKRFVQPNTSGLDMLASGGGATPMSGQQTPALGADGDGFGTMLDLPSSMRVSGPQAPSASELTLAEHSLPTSTDAVDGPAARGTFSVPARTGTDMSKLSVQSTLSASTNSSAKRDTSVHSETSSVSAAVGKATHRDRSRTTSAKEEIEPDDEGQVERVTMLKNCPMCHMPRLSKKAEVDIVTHLAVCASQDWRRVDSLMVSNYVTAMQAHRKWVTRIFSKFSQGQYQLGANSANIIVQDRQTGEMLEEKMQVYVRLGIRLLYKGARSRMEGARIRRMLKNMSIKQGVKFDSPASAREIPQFIAFHSLDVNEIRDPLDSFKTFNEFFYRKLKEDARPVSDPNDPKTLVSSADCRLMAFASVTKATHVWIKGRDFTIEKLLGKSCSKEDVLRYAQGGGLVIFRLAPQDYHRFHCPADARVGKITFIDGQYYTVNPMAIRCAIDVYGENVRAVVPFHSEEFGTFYAVCIGAMMVGSIRLTVEEGDEVKRGQEMGYFAFGGSTIVIVFEEGRVQFDEDLLANSEKAIETLVRVGMRIGRAMDQDQKTHYIEQSGAGDEEAESKD